MGMHEYLERKTAEKCYKIACDIRDQFTTDASDHNWRKHSGAAHVAYAILKEFDLDKPYRGEDDEEND